MIRSQSQRHPHRSHRFSKDWTVDVVPVNVFIQQFGRDAYRALPKEAFIRNGHRKAVTREAIEDNLWRRKNQ